MSAGIRSSSCGGKSTRSGASASGAKPEVKTITKEVERTLKISQIEPNKSQPRKNFDEDALADRICRLIEDDELRKSFGSKALEIEKKASADAVFAQWKEYLESIVDG